MGSTQRNILVLIKGLGIGGAEKLISEGARFWDREEFSYSVAYVLPWKDQLAPDLQQLGVPVHLIGGERGFDLATRGRLQRLIEAEETDLVHAHLPATGILARVSTSVPVVYTEHNLVSSYRTPTRWANRLTYSRNAATIAVSDAVAGSVTGWKGPSPIVIPNGVSSRVEPGLVEQARAELGLASGDPLVVHVGNIRPGKGQDTLVDAVEELVERVPDVTVVSIGAEKFPGELSRLRSRAARVGDGNRMRFLGRREDALSFTAAADVFVNPADIEGLPVAVLEAMSLARPVVATAAGGVPTIIRDGETGILVEPGDAAGLAKGITQLLEDRDESTRLGEGAARLVDERFSLAEMITATEAVYDRVLGG